MSSPVWRLIGVSTVLALLWLVVLPAMADWSAVRARIARHERLGLNPQAIFYSEQPDTLYAPVREALSEHPDAFW